MTSRDLPRGRKSKSRPEDFKSSVSPSPQIPRHSTTILDPKSILFVVLSPTDLFAFNVWILFVTHPNRSHRETMFCIHLANHPSYHIIVHIVTGQLCLSPTRPINPHNPPSERWKKLKSRSRCLLSLCLANQIRLFLQSPTVAIKSVFAHCS